MRFLPFHGYRNGCLSAAFLAITLWSLHGYAKSTNTTLTLESAVAQTLANNPQLYQYTFVSDAFAARRQSSQLRPALAVELEIENFAGSGDGTISETTLALSSVIEIGGKRDARMSIHEAQLNRTQWEHQAATLDVLGELTTVFIDALASQENIRLAKGALRLSQSLLRTVKNRADKGAAPEAEVMRAKAAVARAEIRLAALEQRFDRQKVKLAHFFGETHAQFTTLEGNLYTFGTDELFESLYERVKASPALQVFASDVRTRDAEVRLARTRSRSDITWRVGVRRFEDTGDAALVAGLSIPLFTKSRNSGELNAALAERNAADYAQRASLLRLHEQLYEAHSLRNQNIVAVKKIRAATIPALEKALQLTHESYENGRYGYIDLVAAQTELLAAKQALIDAATNALISQALIEQLTSEGLGQ